jgi:hypothetical protein
MASRKQKTKDDWEVRQQIHLETIFIFTTFLRIVQIFIDGRKKSDVIYFNFTFYNIWTGGRLTEIHLIEIVIFQLIESFNNESFIFYHLTKFFETFQLIEILK